MIAGALGGGLEPVVGIDTVDPAGWWTLGVAYGLVIGQRLIELRVAAQNRHWALDQGAFEVGAGHYPLFVLLHVGWLLGGLFEAVISGPRLAAGAMYFLAAFGLAQVVRYLAITSLGRRWNTRILVFPGWAPIRTGIYRWFAHPNYAAVVIELAALPLVFGAIYTALVASVLNALLLGFVRLPAERKALEQMATSGRPA